MPKTKTYTQLKKQIQALERQADELRRQEVAGVVGRIKEAITAYQLTAADLGFGVARGAKAKPAPVPGAKKARRAAKAAPAVRYRDEAGNVWGGRGPRPRWLREALAGGKALQDLAV